MPSEAPPPKPEKFIATHAPHVERISSLNRAMVFCPYCGHKEAIPTSAEQVQERSFEQYLQIRPEQLEHLVANALEVRCQSCGAIVTFTPPERR